MPTYHHISTSLNGDGVRDIIVKASPVLSKAIPFFRNFRVGDLLEFFVEVEALTEAGQQFISAENFQLFSSDGGKPKPIHRNRFDPLHDRYYRAGILSSAGELEFFLAQGVGENDTRLYVASFSIQHPDNQDRELLLVFLAFSLASVCSLTETMATILTWLFPR